MSLSKRAWEEENADVRSVRSLRYLRRVQGRVHLRRRRHRRSCLLPGQEAALADAIDTSHVTRTPEELRSDEAYFGPWAEAMVKAEVSRGMLDGMWERIKIKLDDLGRSSS
jgi:hypothetical protein